MSSIRSNKEAQLTEVDLLWLVKRIHDFPTAYKSTKSKHEGEILELLEATNGIVTKFNEDNKKAKTYEDALKARNEAFVSLTTVLESNFEAFIKERIKKKKSTDYQKIGDESGHNFHKIVATTLAAIYNDYPDVKSQFGSTVSR